jgi:hypothetical protein
VLKLLIFLILLGLFLAFVYWRLRPYIAAARRVLGVVRDLRSVSTTERSNGSSPARSTNQQGERLVRCLSCGTWTPAGRAVTLAKRQGPSYYCSHVCLERAAEENQQKSARRSQR